MQLMCGIGQNEVENQLFLQRWNDPIFSGSSVNGF